MSDLNQPQQELQITVRFPIYQSPGNKKQLQSVMMNELTSKGLKPFIRDGELYI